LIARLRSVKESNLDPNFIAAALGGMVVSSILTQRAVTDRVKRARRTLIDMPALIEAGSVVL
jgi:hypothetical protein